MSYPKSSPTTFGASTPFAPMAPLAINGHGLFEHCFVSWSYTAKCSPPFSACFDMFKFPQLFEQALQLLHWLHLQSTAHGLLIMITGGFSISNVDLNQWWKLWYLVNFYFLQNWHTKSTKFSLSHHKKTWKSSTGCFI